MEMKYLIKILKLIKTNGIRRTAFLAYVYLVSPFSTRICWYTASAFTRCLRPMILLLLTPMRNIIGRNISFDRKLENTITIKELGLSDATLGNIEHKLETEKEVFIADIDQDGFLHIPRGDDDIKGVPQVDKSHFMPRRRFKLQIVALDNLVAVKKSFGGKFMSRLHFINEIEILRKLAGKCNVPDILRVDYDNHVIHTSYISGAVLRAELAKRGAVIYDRDIDGNPYFEKLSPRDIYIKQIGEGRKHLSECVSKDFVDSIFRELKKCHGLGICINDIKYGNIIIHNTSNKPYLIDFDISHSFRHSRGYLYDTMRDRDIELFNLHFNTAKLTRRRIAKKIKEFSSADWYAPAYFGKGIYISRLWNTEIGDGKWRYILKDNLPPLEGKRVLDLGCNAGYLSTQLLRNGASEVIGIERDDFWITRAGFMKEAYEWADNCIYNLKVVKARIEDVPSMDIGAFDFVMALCCLYYMEGSDMRRLINHLTTITDTVVLQCNVNAAEHAPEILQRASVEYNTQLLKENGFPSVRVIAPKFYDRPFIIATK